jgi:hypothetical protein
MMKYSGKLRWKFGILMANATDVPFVFTISRSCNGRVSTGVRGMKLDDEKDEVLA